MPFMPSRQRDDGYDITDFYGVDSRLGTHGDLLDVIRTAREGGIRVIADLVVNHTSNEHPWFKDARRGADSPYHDFYVWRDEKPEEKPGDVAFPDKENSNWAFDEEAGQWYLHRFYSHQPDLNVSNAEVRDEIAQTVGFWLEQGLSGFRVDAVPFLIEPSGNDPRARHDPHKLLRDLRRYVGRRRGDAVLLGEVNLPPPQQREFFGDEDGDELQVVLLHGEPGHVPRAGAGGRKSLKRALEALPAIPQDCQWANFVRNHDELTLDKLSEKERDEVFAAFGPEEDVQMYGHGLRRRLPTMLGGDQRRIRMTYSLAFSLPGTPVLFYGEEIGMAENLAIEGRYSVRAPMQWSADPQGGFTTADEASRPLVGDGPFSFREVNVASQRRDPHSLLNWMERLIAAGASAPSSAGARGRSSTPVTTRCSRTAATGKIRPSWPSTTSPPARRALTSCSAVRASWSTCSRVGTTTWRPARSRSSWLRTGPAGSECAGRARCCRPSGQTPPSTRDRLGG